MNFKKHSTQTTPSTSSTSTLTTLHNLQLSQLSQTFQILDQDHDGLIKCSELVQIFSQVQIENFNDLSYRYLVKLAQMKPNYLIDFNKFVEIIHGQIGSFGGSNKNRKQELKGIFQLYDLGSGKIDQNGVGKILERLGEPYNKQKVGEWMKEFGEINRSSKSELEYEDFYNLVMRKIYF